MAVPRLSREMNRDLRRRPVTASEAGPAAVQRLSQFLDRTVFAGLLLLLVWLPLPFGTHRPWAENLFELAVFALLVLASLAWALSKSPRPTALQGLALMMALWGLWLAWILLQAQPLPQGWIAALSPHRWQLTKAAAEAAATPAPAHLALSLDPALTLRQALLSAAYAVLFLLLALSLNRRGRFKWLLWTLFASGLLQALYGSVMVLSGLEYGAWGAKQHYRGFATGTFVNRNHFAGYLEICVAVGIGLITAKTLPDVLMRSWRARLRHLLTLALDPRLFARVSIAVFFVALILSQSRMGNVAAVAGVCVASLVRMAANNRQGRARGALLLVGSILLIDIWLFGHWFGLEQLAERYAQVSSAADVRLGILGDLKKMIPVYGGFGSGLGTFMLAYPQFRSPELLGLLDHAHNDYAQFLIETGVPGVALLAVLVLATAARAVLILRRRRDALAQGVAVALIAALAALAVHSTADFNLQIPANAATLIALFAAVWATRATARTTRRGADDKADGTNSSHTADPA